MGLEEGERLRCLENESRGTRRVVSVCIIIFIKKEKVFVYFWWRKREKKVKADEIDRLWLRVSMYRVGG